MKILEHGYYKQVIMCACGCKFQYDKEDVKYIEKVLNWDLKSGYKEYYVKCPECERLFDIPQTIME